MPMEGLSLIENQLYKGLEDVTLGIKNAKIIHKGHHPGSF